MSDQKISAMTDIGAIASTDDIPIVRGGANAKGSTGTMASADTADYYTAVATDSLLSGKQPLDSDLTAFAGLTSAADRLPYFTASAAMALATFTAFARTLLDDADAVTMRATLGLVIGTNVQAFEATLSALAAITSTTGFLTQTAADTFTQRNIAVGTGLSIANPAGVAGDPTISMAGGKQTIFVPAGAMRPSASGGCAALALVTSAANQPDISSLDFDPATEEYAQFKVAMPKSWNNGTVTAQFIWSHAATTTNFKVAWALQGLALSDGDAIAAAYGSAVQTNDTGGTTNVQYISPATAAITIAGTPATGDVVEFRAYRVAADGTNDTMAIDARLHGIILFYTSNAGTDD